MRLLKFVAVLVAAAGVVGLVLVYAPVVAGQRVPSERRSHETAVLSGGVEIGVSVRDGEQGVVVEDLLPDGPAEKAGIKRGDLVADFDGERVRSARQFTRLVRESAIDRAVKMTVLRDGKRTDVQVTPTSRSADVHFDADAFRDRLGDVEDFVRDVPYVFEWGEFGDFGGSRARLGVSVQELTDQLARYFGAKDGVLVTSVADDSAASRAGLKAGDVITAIDGAAVRTRGDLMRGLRKAAEGVVLTVVRDRKEMTVKVVVEARSRTTRLHSRVGG